jgi:hypothetical protein
MVFESVIFSPFGDGSFLPNGRLHKNSYTLAVIDTPDSHGAVE